MPNLQIRRGSVADLPTLLPGEPGLAIDKKKLYIGHPDGNITFLTENAKDRNPLPTDSGYPVPSLWINKLTGKLYVCTDNTNNAAVWVMVAIQPLVVDENTLWVGREVTKNADGSYTEVRADGVTITIARQPNGGIVETYTKDGVTVATKTVSKDAVTGKITEVVV